MEINDTEIKRELDRANRNILIAGIILFVLGILTLLIYIGLLFTAIAIYLLYLYWERNSDVTKYPAVKDLFGMNNPHYIKLLDTELKNSKNNSGTYFTESFIIKKKAFGLDWVHYSEVVWVYKKVTKHYVNFVPTGSTYEICVCSNSRIPEFILNCSGDETKADNIIKLIFQVAPFAIYGYSNELKQLWSKNRIAFIDAVKKRREQFLAHPSSKIVKWTSTLPEFSMNVTDESVPLVIQKTEEAETAKTPVRFKTSRSGQTKKRKPKKKLAYA